MILILERRFMEKYSKQREEIINLLSNCKSHPTAEEIYLILKENGSTASRGTVYRNLNQLIEKGIVIKISIQDGPDRFDYIKEKHNHIICLKCGKVFDYFYNLNENKLKKDALEQTGVEIVDNTFTLKGICNNCKTE